MIEQHTRRCKDAEYHVAWQAWETVEILLQDQAYIVRRMKAYVKRASGRFGNIGVPSCNEWPMKKYGHVIHHLVSH